VLPENPPLGGSYPLRVTLALLALCPNIVLGAAAALLQPDLVHDLGAGRTALSVAEGLSTAGYAFGAVLAVALAKRIEPRRLLLVYESLFVVGSVLAAVSPDVVVFGVGRDLQGLATGMLLVAALPPTVTSFPAAKLATTVAVIDIGLFGAVTLGPLVGGVGAATGGWRWVFVIAGLLAAAAIAIIVASVPPGDPMDPDGPIDKTALPLALGSTVLLFLASGLVVGAPIVSVEVLVPLALGLVLLVTLVVTQYVRENPLTPVRLISHTVPATGLGAAMFAGAAAGSLLALLGVYSSQVLGRSPLELAVGAWAPVLGVALGSVAFAVMFRGRLVPVLVNAGMAALLLSAVGVALLGSSAPLWQLDALGLATGFGAAAGVAPGLFQAALAVSSKQLGPAFALVELLRSAAAFLVAPILLHLARGQSSLVQGTALAAWYVVGITVVGFVVILGLPLAGGVGLQSPDLPTWLEDGNEALGSPPLGDRLRGSQPR